MSYIKIGSGILTRKWVCILGKIRLDLWVACVFVIQTFWYYEVFYDITKFKVNHEEISENIKNIFMSYSEFFCLPFYEIDSYLDQVYFFRFPVKEGHQDIICSQLFEYLLKRTK